MGGKADLIEYVMYLRIKAFFCDMKFKLFFYKNLYYNKYRWIVYSDEGKGHPCCQIMLKFPTKNLCEENVQHRFCFSCLSVCLEQFNEYI